MIWRDSAELVPVSNGASSPEFAQRLAEIARDASPAGIDVSFCGPKGLLKQIRVQMRTNGMPEANLRYEYFEFR